MTSNEYFDVRRNCPACGGDATRTLLDVPYTEPSLAEFLATYYRRAVDRGAARLTDAAFIVDECRSCSLAFQRNVPNDGFLAEIYNDWLKADSMPDADPIVEEALRNPLRSREGLELVTVSAALTRPLETLRVLDYGMGWGLWARVAKRLGCQAYGFDLSRERSEFARKEGVFLVHEHELEGLGFDFINTEQVFEHLTDPLGCARRLAGSLRTGGLLKISVPQAPNLAARLRRPDWGAPRSSARSLNPIHPLEHVNCFTPRALEKMAQEAGLEAFELPLRASYAFVSRHPRSLVGGSPVRLAKELLRPAYHRFSRNNLYRWFRRACTGSGDRVARSSA